MRTLTLPKPFSKKKHKKTRAGPNPFGPMVLESKKRIIFDVKKFLLRIIVFSNRNVVFVLEISPFQTAFLTETVV